MGSRGPLTVVAVVIAATLSGTAVCSSKTDSELEPNVVDALKANESFGKSGSHGAKVWLMQEGDRISSNIKKMMWRHGRDPIEGLSPQELATMVDENGDGMMSHQEIYNFFHVHLHGRSQEERMAELNSHVDNAAAVLARVATPKLQSSPSPELQSSPDLLFSHLNLNSPALWLCFAALDIIIAAVLGAAFGLYNYGGVVKRALTTRDTRSKAAVPPVGIIKLTIEKGSNLFNVDLTGKDNKSDPFAELMVGLHKVKTKAIPNNLSPEWNCDCQFEVDLNHAKKGVLNVVVWDEKDGLLDMSKRKSMGHVDVKIAEVWGLRPNEEIIKCFDLEGEKGQHYGTITVKGEYQPKKILSSSSPSSNSEGILFLHVDKATDLPNVDTGADNLSDPYAEVMVGSSKVKTNTVFNDLSPTWKQQEMKFPVDLRDKRKGVVAVHVCDDRQESEFTTNKSLGTLDVVIADEWGKSPGIQKTKIFDLTSDLANNKGKIQLTGRFIPNQGAASVSSNVALMPPPLPKPTETIGILKVVIEKANNLPKLGATNWSHPYAEATVGSTKHRTEQLPNSVNPEWKKEKTCDFEVNLKDMAKGKLVVHVFDGRENIFDSSGTHDLGSVEIDLSQSWGNIPGVESRMVFNLENAEPDLHSTITLRGIFVPKKQSSLTWPTVAKRANFLLSVESASGLENLDTGKGGLSDPYAVVALAGVTRKSETIPNNLDPIWTKLKNIQFKVDMNDKEKSTLHIEVWDDKDSMSGSTAMIGSVDIQLAKSDWSTQPGKEIFKVVDIMSDNVKKGTIRLKGKLDL